MKCNNSSCTKVSCTISNPHRTSLLFPWYILFSVQYPLRAAWLPSALMKWGSMWSLGRALIKVPKNPDELLMMRERPGSLHLELSGAGGATAAAHRPGSYCCCLRCLKSPAAAVLVEQSWSPDLEPKTWPRSGVAPSPGLQMLMAPWWYVC